MSKLLITLNVPDIAQLPTQNGLPLTTDSTNFRGAVQLVPLKPLQHQGVYIEIQGLVLENKVERAVFYQFEKIISAPSKLVQYQIVPFDLGALSLPYSTGKTQNLEVVYVLRISLKGIKHYDVSYFFERRVHLPVKQPKPYKTEVGADGAIYIEIEAFSQCINLAKECFTGTVHFVLCQKKFEEMVVDIRRRIIIDNVPETPVSVYRYQAMEGPVLRNEIVPFKVPLWCCREVFPNLESSGVRVAWSALIDVLDVEGGHYFKEMDLDLYYAQ